MAPAAAAPGPLPVAELAERLRQADPAALLVPPRILRRVIKKHRRLGGPGLRVPHRKSYIIGPEALLEIATPDELGVPPEAVLPDVVLLFGPPAARALAARPAAEVLREYWRLLFHSHVHLELRKRKAGGRLGPDEIQRCVERIGQVEFEEIRFVLEEENYLFDPDDDAEVFEEFVAVYLDLRYFTPDHLPAFFPGLTDPDAIGALAAEYLDPDQVYARSRPPGAGEPAAEPAPLPESPGPEAPAERETEALGSLRERAAATSRRGNQVRAAVLLHRAVAAAPATQAGPLQAAVRQEVARLVGRLQKALPFPEGEQEAWLRCLLALMPAASRGIWSAESRLLYDLQKICTDVERPQYAVDLAEAVVSGFRRPVKRPLPHLPLVLTVRHLRKAVHLLFLARLPVVERGRLTDLLESTLHRAEARLRPELRPHVEASLDAVGLVPAGAAEELSRARLTDELLDLVAARGRLSIGDLRDAIARNRVKMPDLSGPVEFFTGDPLIRANRRLAASLDGIYRRGEIYLRWLQRLSSVFFGTAAGRFLTLYLILPLLGAFFVLKGSDAASDELHHFFHVPRAYVFPPWPTQDKEGNPIDPPPPQAGVHHWLAFVGLALFFLLLLQSPGFRRLVVRVLHYAWRGVRGVLYDLPAAFFRLEAVRLFLASRPIQIAYQAAIKPALWSGPAAGLLYLMGVPAGRAVAVWAGLAAGVSVVINSRAGMVLEEAAADWLVRTWHHVRDDLLPGIYRWVMWVFRWLGEQMEKVIYTVDEWLRFRQGDSEPSVYAKLVLGTVWFLVTYVFRFIFYVLFEPQINPIKHFPVVTVSHKLMLITAEPIVDAVMTRFAWTRAQARWYVYSFLALIPGVFGFLAWELKENWRLYRANQSPTLDPEIVGSHGERVINLLRPGFHSGTVPRLFASLRSSKRRPQRRGREGLHHVEEDLTRFTERAFLAVLAASRAWPAAAAVRVGHVHLATNSIRIEVRRTEAGTERRPATLEFSNRGGWLAARVTKAGWMGEVPDEVRRPLVAALTGFYKAAGVQVVHEHVEAVLPPGTRWSVTPEGVALAQDGGEPRLSPEEGEALLFSSRPVLWADWVRYWDNDRAGNPQPDLLPGIHLLPGAGVS